jgi:hypothetical protein
VGLLPGDGPAFDAMGYNQELALLQPDVPIPNRQVFENGSNRHCGPRLFVLPHFGGGIRQKTPKGVQHPFRPHRFRRRHQLAVRGRPGSAKSE